MARSPTGEKDENTLPGQVLAIPFFLRCAMRIFFLSLVLILSSISIAESNVLINLEQGGAKQTFGSGAEAEYQSGSTIDHQSGASLNSAGKIDMLSGGEIELSSGSSIDHQSGASIDAAGKIDVLSGGEIEFSSGSTIDIQSGTTIGSSDYSADSSALFKRIARATYDVTVDGGASGATYTLGQTLPANALIQRTFWQNVTQFTGTGSVGLQCESANDIYAPASMTSYAASGTMVEGIQTGTAANMVDTGSNGCSIAATVTSGGTLTAGKAVLWVEYVITE